jgi:general secretion pathway protein A
MYTDWFNLTALPFRLRPDPEFLYLADDVARVLDGLRAAARRTAGTVALVGEAGVGKTTVLHVLARDYADGNRLARLQVADVTRPEVLESLVQQFGLSTRPAPNPEHSALLSRYFAESTGRGKPAIVLVDDAHMLPAASLRTLLDLGLSRPAPLLVLAGEPELEQKIRAQTRRDATLAPSDVFRLPRMDESTTAAYIAHRIVAAGGGHRALFESDAIDGIQRYTGGTPKLINALCDRAMAIAESHSNPRVAAGDIRAAAQLLGWDEFAPGKNTAAEPDGATGRSTLDIELRLKGELVSRLNLRPGRIVIGRSEDADLRVNSSLVSRQHCHIVTDATQSLIEDLGSTNGIVVNGKRVRSHRLAAGDAVIVGDHRLRCVETGSDED